MSKEMEIQYKDFNAQLDRVSNQIKEAEETMRKMGYVAEASIWSELKWMNHNGKMRICTRDDVPLLEKPFSVRVRALQWLPTLVKHAGLATEALLEEGADAQEK